MQQHDTAEPRRRATRAAGPAPTKSGRRRADARAGGARPRIGLALAGGGPLGAVYEIGALRALEDALDGVDLSDLHVYVGVSAGGFIAAGLANGLTVGQVHRLFIESESEPDADSLSPGLFLQPALLEYWQRALGVPLFFAQAFGRWLRDPRDLTLPQSLTGVGRAIPTGLFDGDRFGARLARLFSEPGRTDDFRQLRHLLRLVATDLDTAEAVRFGAPGHDHVPISRAVQASAALPGLFPPVEIEGRHYVDGALIKTLHASAALDEGADLLLCVNPLVPFDARLAEAGGTHPRRLIEGGLPVVLSQTFRALIHSRMHLGMASYDTLYPDADVVLIEPPRGDATMFFTNVFSYANRHRVCEHAYQVTRAHLLARRDELGPLFERHGLRLRADRLADPQRHAGDRVEPGRIEPVAGSGRSEAPERSEAPDPSPPA